MNYRILFSLSVGILVNLLPLNKARAITVPFHREYVDVSLQGIFSANDDNNDQIISPNEVTSFSASFTNDYGLLGEITAEEAKSIDLFEYKIDETNDLAFRVITTGRTLPNLPNDINLQFDVDFQRKGSPDDYCNDSSELDIFRDGDAIAELCDPNGTGITKAIPQVSTSNNSNTQVPEPTSTIALLGLVSLGTVSRFR